MKKRIAGLTLCILFCSTPVYAMDYQFAAPDAGLFGTPTSDNTVYITNDEPVNTNRSKDSAYIPPAFGSPASYLRYAGERLTPNLLSEPLSETVVTQTANAAAILPLTVSGNSYTQISDNSSNTLAYTDVTSALYYLDGRLGTLRIPAINLTVKAYQGTDAIALKKGAGHFEDTSIWDGNVAFAGHNRGVNNHFGKIHTLSDGDKITWTTKLGTKEYRVYSVAKIHKDNVSVLDSTSADILTLVTCVMNQPDYRWCVQAIAK